jgi:hypothetical protein
MRYLFIAAGIPLKKGKKLLVQPARPVFEPVYSARNREIRDRIEARIDLYLHELGLQYQLRAG